MQRNKISFKGQKIYIGIDVHAKTWEVCVLTESGYKERHPQQASAKTLFDFLKKHFPDGEYHAVYESGFSGFSTYYALKEYGIDEKTFLAQLDELAVKAFDDQCTGANPRYPLIEEIKEMLLNVYYGK